MLILFTNEIIFARNLPQINIVNIGLSVFLVHLMAMDRTISQFIFNKAFVQSVEQGN